MGLYDDRTRTSDGKTEIPVWFMRQAGRYHVHYQAIRKNHDFITMCKTPELACEITMGPIDAFDFDGAILFSDLLFPLEQLGLGLQYSPGPKLGFNLEDQASFERLDLSKNAREFYHFQKLACELLREKLPQSKSLLGFAGAPFTLFTYAACGSHAGNLIPAKSGLYDGRYQKFVDILLPEVLTEMIVQAEGGADGVCLFDTAAGELCFSDFNKFVVPHIKWLAEEFKKVQPHKKVTYYAKYAPLSYFKAIESDHIDVIGVDWRVDMAQALKELGPDYYVQGNIDPTWLHLPWDTLEKLMGEYWNRLQNAPNLNHWIAGLGHGVTVGTPQDHVKKAVKFIHDNFRY
ncbi:MAG: uroporphyrinogen decarboxylase [Bacteriovoracaceae bacterium]|jgi:uroporphyrinogen decarboxylase|nr:uroporphyrinogen decarboxylase [Bacteriovoracaceae bacterium]